MKTASIFRSHNRWSTWCRVLPNKVFELPPPYPNRLWDEIGKHWRKGSILASTFFSQAGTALTARQSIWPSPEGFLVESIMKLFHRVISSFCGKTGENILAQEYSEWQMSVNTKSTIFRSDVWAYYGYCACWDQTDVTRPFLVHPGKTCVYECGFTATFFSWINWPEPMQIRMGQRMFTLWVLLTESRYSHKSH